MTGYKEVIAESRLRRFYLLFLFSGAAISARAPLTPLLLSSELGLPLAIIGLLGLTSLTKPFTGIYIGFLSDRLRSRRRLMIFSSLWLAIGTGLYGFTSNVWQVVVISILFFSLTSVLNSQIYAGVADYFDNQAPPDQISRQSLLSGILRSGYSLGYVVGPILGTVSGSIFGFRAAYSGIAFLYLFCIVPLLGYDIVRRNATGAKKSDQGRWHESLRQGVPVAVFLAGICCVFVGDLLKATYVPLIITDQLGYSAIVVGLLLSASALLEIPAFPLMGKFADRIGSGRAINLMLLGAALVYTLFAVASRIEYVVIALLLNTLVIAVLLNTGVSRAQELLPDRSGLASSAFVGAQTMSKPVASLFAAGGLTLLGLSGLFWIPAALSFASAWSLHMAQRRASVANATVRVQR